MVEGKEEIRGGGTGLSQREAHIHRYTHARSSIDRNMDETWEKEGGKEEEVKEEGETHRYEPIRGAMAEAPFYWIFLSC